MEVSDPEIFRGGVIIRGSDIGDQMGHKIARQGRSDGGHTEDNKEFRGIEHPLRAKVFNEFVEDDNNDKEWHSILVRCSS